MRGGISILLALAMLALPASAFAEPPANDDFEDAAVITGSISEEPDGSRRFLASTGGSNSNATTEAGEPGIGTTGASVWYAFTAPEAARYQFAITCCGAAGSLALELFVGGSVGSLTPLATEAPFNEVSLGAGETAYIRISGPIDEGTQEPLAATFEFTAVGRLAPLPRPSSASGTGNPPPPPVTPDTSIATTVISQQSRLARFLFSSTVAGSSFQCKLDNGDFKPCSSPRAYKHLKPGRHAFRVRAVGPTGLLDESAAVGRFAIAEPQRRR